MPRRSGVGATGALFLLLLVAVTIALPLGGVLWNALYAAPAPRDAASPWGVGWARFLRSVLAAGEIGVLATLCAWPAAWAARVLPARWFAVLLVPMLLPSYLAFIGWSQLRAPGNWIGDLLMKSPQWWRIAAGEVCAIGGLVLWSWPLAAVILAARTRRIDPAILDALRLEPTPAWRRALTLAALCRGSLVAAAGAVTLVMLGSAVPLHVAQLDTYAIELWRLLDQTPADQHWRVWAAAWPLILIAVAAGFWIGRRVVAAPESADEPRRAGEMPRAARARWAVVITALLWVLSVIAPGLLMSIDLRDSGFVGAFWRSFGSGFVATALLAAGVGAIALAVACAAWMGLSAPASRRITGWCVGALIAAGLMPGVLIGAAFATAWNRLGTDSDLAALTSLALAHAARLGFVGALVGWWCARSEPAEERALRHLDGADTIRGWFRAAWPTQAGPVLASAVAVGLLSFHEIEAAVMLQPPGLESFPRQMLQLLHYNRAEDLAGAVIVVLGCGVLASAAVVALASLGGRRRA